MTVMKKWRGKGKFYLPRHDQSGRIRSVSGIEAEDRERAIPLIQAEVARRLFLSPVTDYISHITVSEVEEMPANRRSSILVPPSDRSKPRRALPLQPKKGLKFLV